jgi:hypothetical protein
MKINGAVVYEGERLTVENSRALLEEAGRKAWAWLHEQAKLGLLTNARLKQEFEPMIPRYGCNCLNKWVVLLGKIPLREYDQYLWSTEIHNAVNAELGKPIFTP